MLAFGGLGPVGPGCKSAPDLTPAQAQAMVQAKYDQTAPVGVNILVNDPGMLQGATAKFWDRTKVYPNKFWADFKLTPDGKKAVELPGGGDVIQWRPESQDDKNYSIVVTTVAANHLKAHDMGDPQDEMMPVPAPPRVGSYTEGVNLTGVPDLLQEIAHNPGNKLSTKRQARLCPRERGVDAESIRIVRQKTGRDGCICRK